MASGRINAVCNQCLIDAEDKTKGSDSNVQTLSEKEMIKKE
jgi:hypothetical protein